jgi:hypothetical protein
MMRNRSRASSWIKQAATFAFNDEAALEQILSGATAVSLHHQGMMRTSSLWRLE